MPWGFPQLRCIIKQGHNAVGSPWCDLDLKNYKSKEFLLPPPTPKPQIIQQNGPDSKQNKRLGLDVDCVK